MIVVLLTVRVTLRVGRPMFVAMRMSAVHEGVQQRAGQQEKKWQIWDGACQVSAMLRPQKIADDGKETDQWNPKPPSTL